MKIHPRKLLSLLLMWTLVVMIITAIVTQASQESETVIEVVYVEAEPETPELVEKPVSETTEPQKVSLGTFTLTAYCSCEQCCGEYADGYTFTGDKATEGVTIATYPDQIPMGTEVEIEGIGTRIAQDIGGSIYENRIDIFFGGENAHQRALEFGRQNREVFIYE